MQQNGPSVSETPSLEPNQPNTASDAQPEKQPEAVKPGDSGPGAPVIAAQDAVALEGDEAPATLVLDEPATLLHDRAPDAPELTPTRSPAEVAREAAACLRIDHVPAVGHAYVGEPIVLYTRVCVLEDLAGISLMLQVPHWVRVGAVHAPPEAGVYVLERSDAQDELRWELRQHLPAGSILEFETTVVVPALDHLVHAFSGSDEIESEIHSHATVMAALGGNGRHGEIATETAVVAVRRKGSYLKYLPAVYERDPFMARFLMLFESFWAPIDGQIEAMADYFDPMVTTLPMLKWLAERLDLKIDDELPVAVVRRLVQKAVPLYRRRGTRGPGGTAHNLYGRHCANYRAARQQLPPGQQCAPGASRGAGREQPAAHLYALYHASTHLRRPGVAHCRRAPARAPPRTYPHFG